MQSAQALAGQIISQLRDALVSTPPTGIDADFAAGWFDDNGGRLQAQLVQLLAPKLIPRLERLDLQYRHRWHEQTAESVKTWLGKADSEEASWLLVRLLAHRSDLATQATGWAQERGLDAAELARRAAEVPRLVPGVSDDRLVVYEFAGSFEELPGVLLPKQFVEFARAAYWNDEAEPGKLLDLTVGWFGQPLPEGDVSLDGHEQRLEQIASLLATEGERTVGRAEEFLRTRLRLLKAAKTEAPRGRWIALPKPDATLARSAEQLETLLAQMDEPTTPVQRTVANLQALAALLESPKRSDAELMLRYTGWGGLSIEEIKDRIPSALVPDGKALLYEFYTPSQVCQDIARLVAPWVVGLPTQDGKVLALEPAAGIGRLVNAFSVSGFEKVSWTAIEYSRLSSALLGRVRPDIQVLSSSFEEWFVSVGSRARGRFGLVVSNPPYGQRGSEAAIDPDSDHKDTRAYVYFMRRCLELLAEGGIGVFIIPYGFMSATTPYFENLRSRILREAHLRVAFRLPSNLFPGAQIVTDLVILESRGGLLDEVLPEDVEIAKGRYYEAFPTHILGEEKGKTRDEDEYRYTVKGDYSGLPAVDVRPRCINCAPQRITYTSPPVVQKRAIEAELPEHVRTAAVLGERVGVYLDLLARGESSTIARAAALHQELYSAVLDWAAVNNLASLTDFRESTGIASLLSVFGPTGEILPTLAQRPAYTEKYQGGDSIPAMASWLFSSSGPFTVTALLTFRSGLGLPGMSPDEAESELVKAGWAKDFDEPPVWMSADSYFSGAIMPRYRRALAQAKSSTIAAAQTARLRELVRFARITEMDPSPRLGWIPMELLREWMSTYLRGPVGQLSRDSGLVTLEGTPYPNLEAKLGSKSELAALIGFLNYDLALFRPPYRKLVDEEGNEESAEEALDRARVAYSTAAITHFKAWVTAEQSRIELLEAGYNEALGSFVLPTFESGPISMARWGKQIVLAPHQNAVVRRMCHYGGTLNAFDTGVGKTFSGIATIAVQRERGLAKRPVVVVPNTLIWKWYRDVKRCLPDYNVLVVGANRYLNRRGVWVSQVDSAEERITKWRRFQSGQYDVAIVSYSMFGRLGVSMDTWREFARSSPVLIRKLQLTARDFAETIARAEKRESDGTDMKAPTVSDDRAQRLLGEEEWQALSEEEREAAKEKIAEELLAQKRKEEALLRTIADKYSTLSERNRALIDEATDRWAGERAAATDEGLTFEQVGIDLLMIDEAQNFKNIWPITGLEGGTPKYLGAIEDGSDRGFDLAVRRFYVSKANKTPGGTYLLSATPAKNSPLEYFTLIGLVNERAWQNVGIYSVENFIDRYLRIERREVVQPDMSVKKQPIVAGFRNLIELRDIIFRYAEFRTAEEVGLKLPESKVDQVFVDMDMTQSKVYYRLAAEYQATLKAMGRMAGGGKNAKSVKAAKNKALSLLSRLQLVTIHPELASGPNTKELRAYESLPAEHPDVPKPELERRLALVVMTSQREKPGSLDDRYQAARSEATPDVMERWEAETDELRRLARATWVRKKKLRDQWTWNNATTVNRPGSAKLDGVVALIMAIPDCGHIVFCDNIAVHRWLVMLLVAAGFPKERIAIINGSVAKDPVKRLAIADKFNGTPAVIAPDGTVEVEAQDPEYDVVICNMAAYEGIDLHLRTCRVYHLDLPWEPNTLRQRNGRAIRQGNRQAVVEIKFLLARKSLDVVRLEYVLGKLRWMSDLIQSADNQTSNPAAQSELGAEQLVLFLANDPEEAKAAIASLREQQERQAQSRVRHRCWEDVRAIISREAAIRRSGDDEEKRAILQREQQELAARLGKVPDSTWPYGWLLAHARRGHAMTFDTVYIGLDSSLFPVLQDWFLAGAIELGVTSPLGYGWRVVGSAQWRYCDLSAMTRVSQTDDEDAEDDDGASAQAASDDESLLRRALSMGYLPSERGDVIDTIPTEELTGALSALLDRVAESGSWTLLGLKWASTRYKQWLEQAWWPELVRVVKVARLDFKVPVRVGDTFDLVEGDDQRVRPETLVGFSAQAYADFFRFASTNRTDWKYSDVDLTSEHWWGKRFPKGFLRPLTISYRSTRLGKRVKTEPLFGTQDLALVREEVPEKPFVLIHLPSELELAVFASEALGRLAIEKVSTQQDWSQESAPYERGAKTTALLDFLSTRVEPPSEEDLAFYTQR